MSEIINNLVDETGINTEWKAKSVPISLRAISPAKQISSLLGHGLFIILGSSLFTTVVVSVFAAVATTINLGSSSTQPLPWGPVVPWTLMHVWTWGGQAYCLKAIVFPVVILWQICYQHETIFKTECIHFIENDCYSLAECLIWNLIYYLSRLYYFCLARSLKFCKGNNWNWKWKSFSHVQIFATLWTVACQVSLFMEFSRQEYWSGLPCPPPGSFQPRDWTQVWVTKEAQEYWSG